MVKVLKQHFSSAEVVSFLQTFAASLVVDAGLQFDTVLAGDLSKPALVALVLAVIRSFLKVVCSMTVAVFKPKQETV